MNVQHSSRSDSWRTPKYIVDMCRSVLQTIDLDPASDPHANKIVGASCYYTEYDDALSLCWGSLEVPLSVFLNPPGGKIGNQSKVALFWNKLMECRDAGNLTHAIFLAFSIEALQTTQNKGRRPIAEFPLCVPSRRISFVPSDGKIKNQPSHSNMIVYVPGFVDRTPQFRDVFKNLGCVLNAKEQR